MMDALDLKRQRLLALFEQLSEQDRIRVMRAIDTLFALRERKPPAKSCAA